MCAVRLYIDSESLYIYTYARVGTAKIGMSQSERYESEVKDLMLRKMSWSYFQKNTVHKQPFFGA